MSRYQDDAFLVFAIATPLPLDDPHATSDGPTIISKMDSDPETPDPISSRGLFGSARTLSSRKSQRRKFIEVFQDVEDMSSSPVPDSKKSKKSSRTPLRVLTHLGNVTPAPSPRTPDTPFVFSLADPCWENTENYDPRPYATPPPTPSRPLFDSLPLGGRPLRRPGHATRLPRRASARVLGTPRSMELYQLLGLEDWNVGAEEISAAWRSAALDVHPDHAAEDDQEYATLKMQHLNAAKELLLDMNRRNHYHIDGVVPWAV